MDLEKLRLLVYTTFAQTGAAPGRCFIAETMMVPEEEVIDGLKALASQRHLALDPKDEIAMAHPFSSVPLGFSVMSENTLWWGGWAWDSFALVHLLDTENSYLVATTCPNCDNALAWNVSTQKAPQGKQVAHFLIPTSHMWDDVVHTCSNQRIFCDELCVDEWLKRTQHDRGYVMDLDTLWKLASDWYTGRLEKGYVRREPSQAKEYLRNVGLSGSFWGLD